MSATRWPDRHMSVVLTLVSTCRHPTLPAKVPTSLASGARMSGAAQGRAPPPPAGNPWRQGWRGQAILCPTAGRSLDPCCHPCRQGSVGRRTRGDAQQWEWGRSGARTTSRTGFYCHWEEGGTGRQWGGGRGQIRLIGDEGRRCEVVRGVLGRRARRSCQCRGIRPPEGTGREHCQRWQHGLGYGG
jgi:hypothetical protein